MFTPGYIPSPPDERDYPLAKAVTYKAMPMFQGRVWTSAVVNQLEFGVCFAAASAGIIQCIEFKQRTIPIPMSIKYIYGNRKETDFQSEGMIPREGLQMLSRFGVPRYEMYPGLANYPDSRDGITSNLDGEGVANRIAGYVRLSSMQEISDYLWLFGLPVWFCTMLTQSFLRTGADGMVPSPTGDPIGGHAMQCVGIQNGRYILENSWGEDWGDHGFCYLKETDNFSIEAWGAIPWNVETLIDAPHLIMVTIGSETMMVDDRPVTLDSSPVIINQRTMVPLRAISEATGAKVEFYGMPDGKHRILLRYGGEQETI